jgi:hypothetical protein
MMMMMMLKVEAGTVRCLKLDESREDSVSCYLNCSWFVSYHFIQGGHRVPNSFLPRWLDTKTEIRGGGGGIGVFLKGIFYVIH